MFGRTNTGGGGSGGGKSTIVVTAPTGSTVTCSKDGQVKTAQEIEGTWTFRGCDPGEWVINASLDSQTANKTVNIEMESQLITYYVTVTYNQIPDFTYSGDYEIVNDNDEPITVSQDNWKIRLKSSGNLVFTNLNGAENGIDVFLVGGGGGGFRNTATFAFGCGGGGGYTRTERVTLTENESYAIEVGAGGPGKIDASGQGGTTSAFGFSSAGGYTVNDAWKGGNGGSGGGAWNGGAGGSGGNDSIKPTIGGDGIGKGQISTPGPNGETGNTREFGEENGKLYSGGGGGTSDRESWRGGVTGGEGGGGVGGVGSGMNGGNGEVNTGGGGGGCCQNGTPGTGGSGIVIIRNARGVA